MTPILLLVHGWGFDASFWTPLREVLGDLESVAWDLGFRRPPRFPPVPAGRPVVAVGHSFGLLWLLHERPLAWHALVSINGFPRFSAGGDFPFGVPSRLLERMMARFSETPETVYRDFMTRCGVRDPGTQGLDHKALADGLKALRHWDGRSRMAGLGTVDLALAGRTDPIVSPDMTASGFAGTDIRWHEDGHLLPRQAPEWCAGHLRRLCDGPLRDRLGGIEPAGAAPGEE